MTDFTRTIGAGSNFAQLSDIGFDCNTSSGAVKIILPSLKQYQDYRAKSGGNQMPTGYTFTDISNNAENNNIIIECSNGELINGASSVTIAVNGASGSISVSGDSWSVNSAAVSNSGALSYKVYSALLTQKGTDVPTAIVLENTLGVTPTFTYSGVGQYILEATGTPFTNNKTFIVINQTYVQDDGLIGARYGSGGQIYLSTLDLNTISSADDILFKTSIEIRVYK